MTEQQRACAELARAMYPTAVIEPSSSGDGVDVRIYDKPNETRSWYGFNPFNSPDASRELVMWLAEQPHEIAYRFEMIFIRIALNDANAELPTSLFALSAPPEAIARAACKALGIEVSE